MLVRIMRLKEINERVPDSMCSLLRGVRHKLDRICRTFLLNFVDEAGHLCL
jgi:hypothetical protein